MLFSYNNGIKMKEGQPKQSVDYEFSLMDAEARKLHAEGQERYQVISHMSKKFGSGAVMAWLQVPELLNTKSEE